MLTSVMLRDLRELQSTLRFLNDASAFLPFLKEGTLDLIGVGLDTSADPLLRHLADESASRLVILFDSLLQWAHSRRQDPAQLVSLMAGFGVHAELDRRPGRTLCMLYFRLSNFRLSLRQVSC